MPPKTIVFERIAPNSYRTPSRSEEGQFYNLAVLSTGRVMCCCYQANRHGINSCAHAKALIDQGHAVYEETGHVVTIRDDVPGSNFVVECSCGHVSNIASLRREFAEESAKSHVDSYAPREFSWDRFK